MTYYLLLEGDTEEDALYDTNILGEESFDIFYPSAGFMILKRIINQHHEVINSIEIVDEQKKSYSLDSFMDKLEQWKIKSS
jgi:hypothetical protein